MPEIRIGDIGWRVFKGLDGVYLSRMEVVGMSPTGSSIHWRSLDTLPSKVFKGRRKAEFTREGAVLDYQTDLLIRFRIRWGIIHYINRIPSLVKEILESEELLERVD
ncbi:hypothetical protein LCGC14_0429120 [marine sediment metagenome]|uniref:Uncharacterized protein n=1 Tax=marine sediment metagenome TaxID=412755 RepID=A0A0F9SUS7_9ZZZZ